MNGFVILGTDTDAGKTTFALLFLSAFGEHFDYWKPVETGEPDSLRVRKLVPRVTVHEPLARFRDPVAPALAARRERRSMPGVAEIVAAIPRTDRPLLIETFGGPFSPLTEAVLQIELIRALNRSVILVTSSAVGAVGRTLAAVQSLQTQGVRPNSIVLLGRDDEFAREQIHRHTNGIAVVCLRVPKEEWSEDILARSVAENAAQLKSLAATCDLENLLKVGSEDRGRTQAKDYANAWISRDREAVWHPYTSLADPVEPFPLWPRSGSFCILPMAALWLMRSPRGGRSCTATGIHP
jgi:dethiobiotin synthetase